MRRIHAAALVPAVLSLFLGRGASLAANAGERSSGEIDQAAEVGAAIQLALDWLVAHQSPDGSWDCDGFVQLCAEKGASACTGPGSSKHDVGVTGLALLALLRAGGTPAEGKHEDALDKGLKWLVDQQDREGCLGKRAGMHFMYSHGCAALAVVEAYGNTRAAALQEPARKAVEFVLDSQNADAAWRYSSPGDGDNDTSVSGWMVTILGSARRAELEVDDAALAGALAFIDEMTDPETGRTGYVDRGSWPARPPNLMEQFPAEKSESMTAVGVLTRLGNGRTLKKDPLLEKGAELLANQVPRWGSGSIDFYYWYYGTLAMQQIGGSDQKKWNGALKVALLDNQRKDEKAHDRGSWDLVDPWASEGGRIYATALNCLSLESYHRHLTTKR